MVAGTNGKGSFISYITSILGSAGYRVGKYTSPAIFEELETIQVNGKNISEMDFAQYVTRIAQVISEMKTDDEPVPSPFEVETVISFMYFKDCNCDIVVLEAGLGGKLDATNVIDTVLMEVFMPIAPRSCRLPRQYCRGRCTCQVRNHKEKYRCYFICTVS